MKEGKGGAKEGTGRGEGGKGEGVKEGTERGKGRR